jgi:hypothetical protein
VAAPALDHSPAVQVSQDSCKDAFMLSSSTNVPAAQFEHEAAPISEYWPDGHTGSVESPLQYEPAGQLSHVSRVVVVPPEV